ncbi:SHOCT domain-containing protein [Kitasatospora sp. NPDC001159]
MMYWNGGWAWMMLMPLLWIALIGLVVWAVVRVTHQRPGQYGDRPVNGGGPPHRETPREILDRRYASGEIDTDTYREARNHLADQEPRP